MNLIPLTCDLSLYPAELHSFFLGANLYDSSCSPQAKVIFIDKDGGYFLKYCRADFQSANSKKLHDEVELTKYFHTKGLAPEVLTYITNECDHDWLLTQKIQGDDCTTPKYLDHPKRLCDTIAEQLVLLHKMDFSNCPIQNHTERCLKSAGLKKQTNNFDQSFGYASPEEAWAVIEKYQHLLIIDTLLHGDYCLPNIILNDWKFSGFVDLDSGGVGDRHVDVFWGIWTLWYNLKTDKFRQRFIDAYGRDKIDKEMLHLIAAVVSLTD